MVSRKDIINEIAGLIGAKKYLEIGVAGGECFEAVRVPYKTGVDPNVATTCQMTSDRFFGYLDLAGRPCDLFDLVFIDGLHEANQVLRDVGNSLRYLVPGGVIVLHDCLPETYEQQMSQEEVAEKGYTGDWCGDVWKAMVLLCGRVGLDTAVVDCDWGVGIVIPRRASHPSLKDCAALGSPLDFAWGGFSFVRDLIYHMIQPSEVRAFILGASD